MVKAKKFILKKHFDGFPKPGDVVLAEEELRELEDDGKSLITIITISSSQAFGFPLQNFWQKLCISVLIHTCDCGL